MESFVDGALTLELEADGPEVRLLWRGRSTAREPGVFLVPALTQALETAQRLEKRLLIDFRELEYLNSSTITPLVRVLEQAKRSGAAVTVVYAQALKWQTLAFSALHLFSTPDGRVRLQGD